MSANFSRLVSSKVLTLVPNDTEEKFLVHAKLLASQSECLGSLIKNIPEECSDPRPELDIGCWESATVGRFVEFVYTGDYHCPDPVPLETPVTTPEGGSVSGSGGNDVIEVQQPTEPAQDSETGEQYWELAPIMEMFAPGISNPKPKLSAAESFARKYFHPTQHDFEEVFLTHAKIYAIARNLGVEDLCILALQRLLRTLPNIGPVLPGSVLVSNFVDLARFVYAAIAEDRDPFKDLVSQFAALNFTSMQTLEMTKLMREGGGFASDLMEKISVTLTGGEFGDDRKREELNKEIEGLIREVFEGSLKQMEDMKEIERLIREVFEGSLKQMEDMKEIERLKIEVFEGSLKQIEYMKETEKLREEFLVENTRVYEELKKQMAGFQRELREGIRGRWNYWGMRYN